jgi:hypothetical protein
VDENILEDLLQRMAVLIGKLDESYDKLVELHEQQKTFNEQQLEINKQQVETNQRLERLLAEVIRQRRNGNPN